MVDINLIGDDKLQNGGEENGENLSDSYTTVNNDVTSDSHLSDADLDHNIYDRSYTKSSSKKMVFTIIGLISVAAIVILLIFLNRKPQEGSDITKLNDTEIIQSKDQETQATNEAIDITAEEPVVDIPSPVKELIYSTRNGVKAVENILTTIPENVNFTLIQYRDGNFLTEILGRSEQSISNLSNQLQQNLSSGDVKILSRDTRNIKGYSYKRALIGGSLSSLSSGALSNPQYLNPQEIKNKFTQECSDLRLVLKEFKIVQNEIQAGNYKKIPVIFRATGSVDAALNFLNRIVENNYNVNLSKIVLISSDMGVNNSKIVLVLNMEIYQPI